MVDHATRYVETVALSSDRDTEVAETVYTQLYERCGPVVAIPSYGGHEFTSALIKNLHELMGARHLVISPFHPQSNGATERVNSTLLAYLRALTEEKPGSWPRYLAAATYAFNTTHQTMLGCSHYFLMFGREPVDTMDLWMETALQIPHDGVSVDSWGERLEVALFLAQELLIQQKEKFAARINKNRRNPEEHLKKGTFVYWS